MIRVKVTVITPQQSPPIATPQPIQTPAKQRGTGDPTRQPNRKGGWNSGISNNVGIKRILCLVSCNALTLCASNPTGEVNTMQNILGFLVSTPGRAIRLIVGAGMIVYGLFLAGSIIGYGIAAIGLVVFAITAGDGCIFSSSKKAS